MINQIIKKKPPLVSVILPCYNHERYVQESILSVIRQDYQEIELIIIDDGSSDNSVERINSLIDLCTKRFTRFEFRTRQNKGLSATLNEAIEWCKGLYISAIASDDGWYTQKITTQVNFLISNPKIPACCSNIEIKGLSGKTSVYAKNSLVFYRFNDIFLFKYNLPAPTLMFNKERIKFFPIYSENHYVEDFYFFLKITSMGYKVACLPNILGFYRRHSYNTSGLNFKLHGEDRIRIINEYRKNHLWKKSVSISMAIQATQTLSLNKIEGLGIAIKALKIDPMLIFSRRFIRFMLYFFMPKSYIKINLSI